MSLRRLHRTKPVSSMNDSNRWDNWSTLMPILIYRSCQHTSPTPDIRMARLNAFALATSCAGTRLEYRGRGFVAWVFTFQCLRYPPPGPFSAVQTASHTSLTSNAVHAPPLHRFPAPAAPPSISSGVLLTMFRG